MSNHFKKHTGIPSMSGANPMLQGQLQNIAPAPRPDNLGWFGNRKLRQAQREVILTEEKQKMAVDTREALATYEHAATQQGLATRTSISRIYGDLIAAELGVMGECHAAAVQAQKVARISATMVNVLSKNEHIAQVRDNHQKGLLTTDDADALINQIIDQHMGSEDRLDAMSQAVADTTDRVYMSGLAPVKHGVI